MMRERDLENLLFHHPYLLGEEFSEIPRRQQKRQVTRGKNRLDLIFEFPDGACIVELKITALTVKDVEQLLRYCANWNESGKLGKRHFLIGKRPRNESLLLEAVKNCAWEIQLLYLDEHLPTEFVFDEEMRRYRPYVFGEITKETFKL